MFVGAVGVLISDRQELIEYDDGGDGNSKDSAGRNDIADTAMKKVKADAIISSSIKIV